MSVINVLEKSSFFTTTTTTTTTTTATSAKSLHRHVSIGIFVYVAAVVAFSMTMTSSFASVMAIPSSSSEEAISCQEKLTNCTDMVNPYLRDVRYMFPTLRDDVDEMCKVWSRFVDCVRRYVSSCFSDERRTKFNMAVENSIDTVHAICSSDSVQREYLSNAVCFRRVSAEYCSTFYSQLVHHVSSPKTFDDHICCAYSQFRKCVHDPLLRECGQRSRNLLDHSLSFLVSKCGDKSIPLNERCPSPIPDNLFVPPHLVGHHSGVLSDFPRQRFRSDSYPPSEEVPPIANDVGVHGEHLKDETQPPDGSASGSVDDVGNSVLTAAAQRQRSNHRSFSNDASTMMKITTMTMTVTCQILMTTILFVSGFVSLSLS